MSLRVDDSVFTKVVDRVVVKRRVWIGSDELGRPTGRRSAALGSLAGTLREDG